jgi:ParB-like chromosome segregation protein Spo0J
VFVSISLISVPEDEGHRLSVRTIESMAVALMLEQPLPPVKLLPRADGHYDLADGRHRFVAYLLAGHARIAAEVTP